uniref:CSRNP_N domain-containing protein n=1 Tax=Parastrongyloides trichosuri TaxID=131310 RepID=A0A0N4ZET9_PARTI
MTSFNKDVLVQYSPAQIEIKSFLNNLLNDVDNMSIHENPKKSCLKRRLTIDDDNDTNGDTYMLPSKSPKISKHVSFSELIVYWFERAQGKCSIPSYGGLPLGMDQKHCSISHFSDCKKFKNFMKHHKARLNKERWDRFAVKQNLYKTSRSRKNVLSISTQNDEESSITEEKRIADDEMRRYTTETKNLLKMPSNVRKNIFEDLKVEIDEDHEKDTHLIRENRKSVGCECEDGICRPNTCLCSVNGIQCYLDSYGNPACSCNKETCFNPEGVIEYKEDIVRCHYDYIKEKEKLLNQLEKCFDGDKKSILEDELKKITSDYALKMIQLKQSPMKKNQYSSPQKSLSIELKITAHEFLFDSPEVNNFNGTKDDTEFVEFPKMPSLITNRS